MGLSFNKKSLRSVAAMAAVSALALGAPSLAGAQETLTLGSAISLTGKYSSNGVDTQNGYNLAVKKINEMGGVKIGDKTYNLEIKYYDDESTPARTAQLLERLIEQDGVKYILGPYSSATTLAAAPVTEKYKVPMIEAEGASRALFNKGYKYIFAVLSTAEQYLASAVDLAGMLITMIGLVIDDKMPPDLSDISATLTKVKAVKPDVLLISGHNKGAVTAARQIQELQVDVPLIAMTHCEGAKVTDQFGASANGYLCPTQWAESLSYKDEYFGTASEYHEQFKKTYEGYSTVPYQAAQATAAVLVWKDALERAGSLDIEKVREAIAATDMATFYGQIKFGEAGNNIAKPMVLRQIQKGEYNVVAPSEWASHQVEWPRMAK